LYAMEIVVFPVPMDSSIGSSITVANQRRGCLPSSVPKNRGMKSLRTQSLLYRRDSAKVLLVPATMSHPP
jgi:hypothetical protein